MMDQQKLMKYFYMYGVVCFLLVAIYNIWIVSMSWTHTFILGKISNIAMILFYFALCLVFYSQAKAIVLIPISQKDLDKAFKGDKKC